MKTYVNLINDVISHVSQMFPWDLHNLIQQKSDIILLDIREPYEFESFNIENSLNVPRGLLEPACDYGYDETQPWLVRSREKEIIVICRSGNRSVLAAYVMQLMGFNNVKSLKSGIKGWNDAFFPLVDTIGGEVEGDVAALILDKPIEQEKLKPISV